MHTGNAYRFYRKQAGLTQKQLAKKMGKSNGTVSQAESASEKFGNYLDVFLEVVGVSKAEFMLFALQPCDFDNMV